MENKPNLPFSKPAIDLGVVVTFFPSEIFRFLVILSLPLGLFDMRFSAKRRVVSGQPPHVRCLT